MAKEAAVELRDVATRFTGPTNKLIHAVPNVTLNIRSGEFFSPFGPSGRGQTTPLRMSAGFANRRTAKF